MTNADDRPSVVLNWLHARWLELRDALSHEERPDFITRGNAYRILHDDPRTVGESATRLMYIFAVAGGFVGGLTLIAQLWIHGRAGAP